MKVLFFDTETSGLNPQVNVILQLSYQIVSIPNWSIDKTVNHYFPWPEERNRVSSKAIAVNGLTEKYLSTQQLSNQKTALEEFVKDKDSVQLIVAHNLEFDKKFIIAACKENKVKFAASGWDNVYDTMKRTTDLCRIEKYYGYGYKYPKLIELADYLHINYSDLKLHDSSSDVELTKRCFKTLIEIGYYNPKKQETSLTLTLNVETADDYTFKFIDENNNVISEAILVSNYGEKAVVDAKRKILRIWAEQSEDERNSLKDVFLNIQSIRSASDFQAEMQSIIPEEYERRAFSGKKPIREEIEADLYIEAKEHINSIMFWTNAKKQKQYVEERLEAKYKQLENDYYTKLKQHEETENQIEKQFNQNAILKTKKHLESIEKLLSGDISSMKDVVSQEDIFSYPLTIDVQPEVIDSKLLKITVDLPNISNFPKLYGYRLSSGNYKIKELTEKEKREDYALSTTNLAFYLAACYFNVLPTVECIGIIGWKSSDDGKEKDREAIYAFEIKRQQLIPLIGNNIKGFEEIKRLKHNINLSKTFIFKPINPQKLTIIELNNTDEQIV